MERVHTETPKGAKCETKVELFIFEQNLTLILVENSKHKGLNRRFVEGIKPNNRHKLTINAEHWRQTNLQVKVGCPTLNNLLKEYFDS